MKTLFLFLLLALLIQPLNGLSQHKTPSDKRLDFSEKDMTDYNFTAMPAGALVGALFINTILNGAQFQNMDLTGANFTGAIMGQSKKSFVDLSGTTLDHTNFQQAQMQGANFQYAVFKATDLTDAQLIDVQFGPVMTIQASSDNVRTKFVRTILDLYQFPIARWPTVYWSYTDLSYSRISGFNYKTFSFASRNITGARMQGVNFSHFNFRNCIMSSADLSNANLSYADLSGALMFNAKLQDTHLLFADLTDVKCYTGAANSNADFSGASMNNATLDGGNFSYAVMSGAVLIGTHANNCTFDNADFQSTDKRNVADFSSADISGSSFNKAALNSVKFSNVFAIGTQFTKCTMETTNFSGAVMPGASFDQSSLQGVLFTGAILQNAIFTSTELQPVGGGAGVDFSCSQLGGADFTDASVLQANFADAVMLPVDSCCQKVDGTFCGIITINQKGYGATVLPKLTTAVTCPNGESAVCKGQQWIVPNWNTPHCNSQHTAQTIWTKPDCDGGGQDTVGAIQFKDPNLKAAIVHELFNGDNTKAITSTLAAQVLSLDCAGYKISNLEGLEYFKNLRTLDLSQNNLADGNFFMQLSKLNTLKIANNKLASLTLLGLKDLVYLDASNNVIKSLVLDAGSFMNFIDASSNQLAQLDVSLQGTLNYLDLSYNKLTKVGDLSGLQNIAAIFLENNSLQTIGNVKSLYNEGNGNLTFLNLACNTPFDCSSLGLNTTPKEKDFLKYSKCNTKTGVGCSTKLRQVNYSKPAKR